MKRLMLLAALLCSANAVAQQGGAGIDPFTGGSADAGAGKAAVCGACHGPGGNSAIADNPKLAGQHANYTYQQLKVLKTGERKAPVMNPMAAPLSDQDMKDLAAYFAAQKPQPGVASLDAVKVAEKIYRAGDPARQMPGCIACHGPKGAGNAGAAYPRIGGQHARYSAVALRNYRGKTGVALGNANAQAMAAIAAKLTDAEIDALASYVNGLH
jgi:cytochrome c553